MAGRARQGGAERGNRGGGATPGQAAAAGREPRKRGSSRGAKRRRSGCAAALLLLVIAAGAAGFGWWLLQPYQGYGGGEKLVDIAPGTGAARILAQLQGQGVLWNATVARAWLVYVLKNPPLQAGQYRFAGPLTFPRVLDKLVRGDVISLNVTIVEGFSLEEIADQLARAGAGRKEVFLAEMRKPAAIADLDPAARDLEGYLFPETYRFHIGAAETEIVATLVKTFRTRFERNVRPLMAGRTASVREVVTLASIVEKEARAPGERPVIAGVYQNRLDRRMGLDADPTVIYALRGLGRWDGTIHHDDLRVDSPYNTYRFAGLPPGPICSPGLPSLEAAANPAKVPYLYFVSRNDGTHVFASTLEEQNHNVDIWQRRYWRERRQQERAAQGAAAPAAPATPPQRKR